MTVLGDLVRRLGAAGLTLEQIALAIDAAETAGMERDDRRRHMSSERQQRWRDSKRALTVTPSNAKDATKKRDRSGGTMIDPEWQLSADEYAYAVAKGLPASEVDAEAERFKNFWLGNGRKKRNWAATWRTWVTSPYRKGNAHGQQSGLGEAFSRLSDRAAAREVESGAVAADNGRRGDSEGQATLRLVPPKAS